MAVYDVLPDYDLRDVDIVATLNANGGSVSYHQPTWFSSAAKLNHWAKYKPVISATLFFDLETWKASGYRGDDGNCGFSILQLSSYTLIPSKMDGDMNGWKYLIPTGGSNANCRMDDFRGYNPKAMPMIGNFYVPDRVSNDATGVTASAMIPTSESDSVTLADLSLSSCYSGVLITDTAGTVKKVAFGLGLSVGAFSVLFGVSDLTAGTYVCYPFIAAKNSVSASGQKYYTIPNVKPKEIRIVASYFAISVRAARSTTVSNAVDYTITINNTSTAVTWTNNAYKLRFFGNSYELEMQQGEKSGSLVDITVPANGSKTITGTITGISVELWAQTGMMLWVSFKNGAEIQDTAIIENTQE